MLILTSSVAEPSALVAWMWALIFIAGILVCAAIVYAVNKLVKRLRKR